MPHDPEIHHVLGEHLRDPSSSFSIGSFGAIAEFHRDAAEPLILDDAERLTIATARGALRIDLVEDVKPCAYETLSGRPGRWQHGVVFCLPEALGASHNRSTVTELGPDRNAIRPEDRDAVLFDMGLSARNVDFCVRTKDAGLLALLRQVTGRSILAPGSAAMAAIVEASPHRIAISRLGRAEVYQAIGKVKTPDGPHTHVLPKLLRSGRTHAATIPVPRDFLPCLSLYPANPLYDGKGRERRFDEKSFEAFQAILDRWGAPAYCAERARALGALRKGEDPEAYDPSSTRLGRTALRVALRQARQQDGDTPSLSNWSRYFDASKNRRKLRPVTTAAE